MRAELLPLNHRRIAFRRISPSAAGPLHLVRLVIFTALLGGCFCENGRAADLVKAQEALNNGSYELAVAQSTASLAEEPDRVEWRLVLGAALTQTGRYADAAAALTEGVELFPRHLGIRLAAYEALLGSGEEEAAKLHLAELDRLGGSRPWAYREPGERLALGRVALIVGADPKRVLELFFDPVRKEHPELPDSYAAAGELALSKGDDALAAKTFRPAVAKFPENAELWFGLARAYSSSDAEAAGSALERVLKINPQHVGAHLLLANHHLDGERYGEADAALQRALKINPHHPEAHAYRAVLANLRADEKEEKAARAAALKPWPRNPRVPHLIGRKLSQKYRFAEGATWQREALKFEPTFLAAKAQLANDLLRLGGHDEEAWRLVEEVQNADPYDVVAYNLATLRDAVKHFRTLTSANFSVKMDPKEAEVYGADVLALLERAHATLTRKYGLQLRDPTIVEIFPDPKDFAIRTFGLPGGAGYLGVCFGRVITANSPASRPNSPANWQAVLWHEFAHVVTLTLTKNKMPRWLSEGISVYEERQARSSWGEQMKPRYRAMILGDDLTPVSQLSAAFLSPKTPAHLGFAYYESSLVVEWLVNRWGLPKMQQLMADLGRGVEINAALATHFAPIEQLDAEFATHARELAKQTGSKLDWTRPKPSQLAGEEGLGKFLEQNPNNYSALLAQAKRAMDAREWEAAKAPLRKLIELYPNQHDSDSAYALLAKVHHELGEIDEEKTVLSTLAELSADATEAYVRLAQLAVQREDWPKVLEYSSLFQAVDPLRPEPHLSEAIAREALNEKRAAIAKYRTLLQLGTNDPPEIHFRLASLLHATGSPEARQHVILALEEAPRFRAAHELHLQIADQSPGGGVKSAKP